MLCKQKGFRDDITSIYTNNSEAIANSFWDTKDDAEVYNDSDYPQVLKALSK